MANPSRSRTTSDAVVKPVPSTPVKKDASSNRNRIISAIAVLILGGAGVALGVLNPATHQFFMTSAGALTDWGLGLTIAGSTIGGGSLLGLAFWPRKKASPDTPNSSAPSSRKSSTVGPEPDPAPVKSPHKVIDRRDDLSDPTEPSAGPPPQRTPSPPLPPGPSPVTAPASFLYSPAPNCFPAPTPIRPMTAPPISSRTDPTSPDYVGPQAAPSPIPSHLLPSAAPFAAPSSPGDGPASCPAAPAAAPTPAPLKAPSLDVGLPNKPTMGPKPVVTFAIRPEGYTAVDGTGTCFFYSVALGEKQLKGEAIADTAANQDEIYQRGQSLRWQIVQWMHRNVNDPKLQAEIKKGLLAHCEHSIESLTKEISSLTTAIPAMAPYNRRQAERTRDGTLHSLDQFKAARQGLRTNPLNAEAISAYLEELTSHNRYATGAEMYALSQHLKVHIAVIHSALPLADDGREWAREDFGNTREADFTKNGTIYLLFDGHHFNFWKVDPPPRAS